MSRFLVKYLNAPFLILFLLFSIALQSTLFKIPPLHYFQPDILLIALIWIALKRTFLEGGILTLIIGTIAETHSSAPQGLFLNTYMILFLTLQLLDRYLILTQSKTLLKLTLFCFIYWKALELGFLYFIDLSHQQIKHTLIFLIPGALLEVLLAQLIFPLLEKFDWKTYKNPKASQVLDDELRLEEEGV